MKIGLKLLSLAIATMGSCVLLTADAASTNNTQLGTNHWAYKAPVKPAVPSVRNQRWVRDPIDNFILAKLERENLHPSIEADKITLLRRLSLDLTGLPPTINEVNAFLADKSTDAYEKQVERLLASPHYGERWARHWLDAARYADSDGYEKDMGRDVWFYRDWVINAINRDLPYDQFIIEQIAGDQLPNPTQDQIVATGFLRNSMVNAEGAVDPEQFRMEAMFDRMDAIGKSVLGITIQCAQCHDHKFDPLTQEEYYRMFAFINNDDDGRPSVYLPGEIMKIENLRCKIADIEAGLCRAMPDWKKKMADWEKVQLTNQPVWTVLDPDEYIVPGGASRYEKLKDGSILGSGYAPPSLVTKFTAKTTLTNITAIRMEVLTDPSLPFGGPGRSPKGTFALTELRAEISPIGADAKKKTKVKFSRATSDAETPEGPLDPMYDNKSGKPRTIGPARFAIDGDGNTAWMPEDGPGNRNVDRKAVFELATNEFSTNGMEITLYAEQHHGGGNGDDHLVTLIGRMRFSVTDSHTPVNADPLPKMVRDIVAIPSDKRSANQQAAIFSYYRTTVPEFSDGNKNIAELMAQWPEPSSTLTLHARNDPRATHILKRGDSFKPEREVTAGVPAFLNPLPKGAPLNRLTFARWMVDRQSPTTARVFVNRIWQEYFGIGLDSTPEDLGVRTETPSHPELLDWLACEFMDTGWSLKKLQRLIVTSETYRQSSHITSEMYERDPYNRLLARGPRFRVDGEVVRDIALATSGLLTQKIGGPSVYSPAPMVLFEPPASYARFNWPEATGADRYRRALYTFRRRSTPYPMLQNFDAPNGDTSCVRRSHSNTPLQALTTLNETVFVESAQALAMRTLREAGTNDVQLAVYVFRTCEGRKPDAAETDELLALLKKEEKRLADGWLEPKLIAYTDPAKPPTLPKDVTPTQVAAWTLVSRVVLNLDETITKE